MKIFLSAVLVLVAAFSSFGSTLIFKSEKEIVGDIGIIDTAKYKQIRIVANGDKNSFCSLLAFGVEEKTEYPFYNSLTVKPLAINEIFDTPPTKIKLTTKDKCFYSIFVYAS